MLTACNEQISHAILPVALSYVASSLAEPCPRITECLTPQVYIACYPASCAAQRDVGLLIKPCSYSFLTQGKITCENILRARICTAVRTVAKRGTYFVSILCTYIGLWIVPRTLGNSILGWRRRSNKHAICFKQVKKDWRQVNEKIHIGVVEKAQKTSSDSDMHNTVCLCHIALLHEQWMCLGMQRNTHITGNNLIPISVPTLPLISYIGNKN